MDHVLSFWFQIAFQNLILPSSCDGITSLENSADAGGNLIMWEAREGERGSLEKRGNIQTWWPSAMKLSLKCCSIIRGSKKEGRELIIEFHYNTLPENLHWTKKMEAIKSKIEEKKINSMYVLYTMILDMK